MEKDESNSTVLVQASRRETLEYDHPDLRLELFTDSEMTAAQQLMQLSDEDDNNSSNNYKESAQKNHVDQEVDQLDHHQRLKIGNGVTARATWAKIIEEIFGKEYDDHDHDYHRGAPKKRKYRSLASIYSGTEPMREMKVKMKIFNRKS